MYERIDKGEKCGGGVKKTNIYDMGYFTFVGGVIICTKGAGYITHNTGVLLLNTWLKKKAIFTCQVIFLGD